MKQYTKEEIYKILIDYGNQNEGNIDLSNLDFGDLRLDYSKQKADVISNSGQKQILLQMSINGLM